MTVVHVDFVKRKVLPSPKTGVAEDDSIIVHELSPDWEVVPYDFAVFFERVEALCRLSEAGVDFPL